MGRGDRGRRPGDRARLREPFREHPVRVQQPRARAARQGRCGGAIADFTKAIELAPDYATAYLNRGSELARAGELERAFADLDRAVGLDPGNVIALALRGMVRADLGETSEAVADLRAALALDPDPELRALIEEALAYLGAT